MCLLIRSLEDLKGFNVKPKLAIRQFLKSFEPGTAYAAFMLVIPFDTSVLVTLSLVTKGSFVEDLFT